MSRIAGLARDLMHVLGRYPCPPLLTAFILGLTLWNLPIAATSSEIDVSLIDVLTFARENHLQFGPEITSTYGPLGWLYFPYYSPHSGLLQFYSQLLLSIAALSGCCLLAWRLTMLWRCIFLSLFTWAAANMAYRADLLVEVGLLCWGSLCLVETNRRLLVALAVFAIFAALASLAKISFLFIAGASICYIGSDLLLRGRRAVALGLAVGFAAIFLVGWIASSQSWRHLGTFILHAFFTVQSYDQALGLEGLVSLRLIAFLLTILLFVLIGLRSATAFGQIDPHCRLRRVLLFLWLALFTFTSWKHGFIRLDDFHPPLFLGFCLVVSLSSDILSIGATRTRRWSRVLGALTALFSAAFLQTFFFSPMPLSLAQPLRELPNRLSALLHPLAFNREMARLRADVREEYQLPQSRQLVGQNSVDVFGQYQAFAIDNDLNFKPRPVFQSYNACNRSLMALNQDHFLLNQPHFVLFDLKAMDDKLPPLEDAWLLRHLLINYKPIAEEKRFILLQANSTESCRLSLLVDERVPFGRQIDLQKYGENPLWLEIELTPSFRGRLRQLFYASPVIRLGAWSDSGKKLIIKRRAPRAMLASGFLASPLLLRTEDISNLAAGKKVARPAAYSVEPTPGQESLWHPEIHYRIYKIENAIPGGPRS